MKYLLTIHEQYALFGAAREISDGQVRQRIDTNLIGSIQVALLQAQSGGRVIQVSLEGGQIAYSNFSLYHTTEWDIEGILGAVANEVAPFNNAFTSIEPGPFDRNGQLMRRLVA